MFRCSSLKSTNMKEMKTPKGASWQRSSWLLASFCLAPDHNFHLSRSRCCWLGWCWPEVPRTPASALVLEQVGSTQPMGVLQQVSFSRNHSPPHRPSLECIPLISFRGLQWNLEEIIADCRRKESILEKSQCELGRKIWWIESPPLMLIRVPVFHHHPSPTRSLFRLLLIVPPQDILASVCPFMHYDPLKIHKPP